jgi:hypothetical protein
MDGTSLPNALIYPAAGNDIQDVWLEDYTPEDGTWFTSSPNGWTSDQLAFSWLTGLFDRFSKPRASQGRKPRLIFLDGHSSHLNLPFIDWCDKHNIHICAYPPHTTHRLQPLDVSLFSPLSSFYSQELDQWIQATQGLCRVSKREFYKMFKAAYDQAFTEKNILSGWKRTGLSPFDPSLVLNQLSTRPQPPEQAQSRPVSSSAESQSSLTGADWKKMNSIIREAVGESVLGPQGRELARIYQETQTELAIYKARCQGLELALQAEKRKKKPRQGLFKELRGDDGNQPLFFSPNKVAQARELHAKK